MGALTGLSDAVNRASGGNSGTPEAPFFMKNGRINGVAAPALIAGQWTSLWRYDGMAWGGGANPGAVTAPTRATAGALSGWSNPGGGRERRVVGGWASSLNAGTLLIYDRLLQYGGVGNVATAQTVGGTLTRNTLGNNNFMFVEIGTIIGTTGTTVTASYTNEAGTSGRTTQATTIGGTGYREETRAIMLPLQGFDFGVRACASFTLTATTGTAGVASLVIGRPIGMIPCPFPGSPGWRDFLVGLPLSPVFDTDACIAALWRPATTAVPEITGGFGTLEV